MEADLYPPDIVTLCPSRVSMGMSVGTQSPLSSAPNSPGGENTPRRRSFDGAADEEERQIPFKRASDAPFDEHIPDDEKKTDGDNAIVGKYEIGRRTGYRVSIEDDSSQPPALKIHNNKRESWNDPEVEREPKKPSALRQRARTTGDIRPTLGSLKQKYSALSPNASNHNRKPSVDMQQQLKFAALKRDIVSINEQPNEPAVSTAITEPEPSLPLPVAMTPEQGPQSPPKVVKKQMWNSDPTGNARNHDLQNLVSPSPRSTDAAWPSFYDASYEADDLPMNLAPKTNFSMVSPDGNFDHRRRTSYASYDSGEIPLPTNSKSRLKTDHDNAYDDHNDAYRPKVYSEEEMTDLVLGSGSITKSHSYDSQPHDEGSIDEDDDQPDDEKLNPWVSTTALTPHKTPEGAESKAHQHFSPFHPQGAVRLSRGQSEPQEIIQEQPSQIPTDLAVPNSSNVSSLFASALSDAVDFAATGAVAMGNFAFGAKTGAQASIDPYGCVRVEAVKTKSSSSYDQGEDQNREVIHPEAVDWVNYLKIKGVDSKSSTNEPSSAVCVDWINSNSNTRDSQDGDQNSTTQVTVLFSKDKQPEGYPKVTPKKDLQTSEKSAAWLQEEFRRRSIIKKEINDAILERNETPTAAAKKQFAEELTKALEEIQAEGSQSTTDDEVAALTQEDEKNDIQSKNLTSNRDNNSMEKGAEEGFEMQYHEPGDEDKPMPRRLDFQISDHDDKQDVSRSRTLHQGQSDRSTDSRSLRDVQREARLAPSGSMHSLSNNSRQSRSVRDNEVGRTNPIGRATERLTSDPLAGIKNMTIEDDSLNTSLQEEMQRFVSNTRAALRKDLAGETPNNVPAKNEFNLLHSPFRSIAISNSGAPHDGTKDHSDDMDLKITYPVQSVTDNPPLSSKHPIKRSLTYRSVSEGASSTSDYSDMQSTKPALIHSMDSAYGIAKGDITLSLLNENTGRIENSAKATWANRVHGAIWRCRRMRRKMGAFPGQNSDLSKSPQGRSSLPVDLDRARVAGGFKSVASTQEAALNHLKVDEVDEAIELFEDIIFAYYSYFERTLKARELNPGSRDASGSTNFKPYIGVALHNLGILHLLNGEYQEALSFFSRAVENRRACLGEGHRDHVVSLSKLAICHYALNEFGEAHSRLEEALDLAGRNCTSLEDRVQVAEILNNLGCLAYMCGQPVAANAFFRDSLDVQFRNLSDSLYEPAPSTGQSISLNISISRANIGFVGLVTKELPLAITALENALMEQQILLHGANETAIATMDHLAVANLLNGEQEKAAQMFGRILVAQQKEYGRHDRRCFVTMDKINMVQSQGQQFEIAIEELRKTFSMPQGERPNESTPLGANEQKMKSNHAKTVASSKGKGQKSKVLKVFSSIRKSKK